jgi:hypothetical protein
MGFFVEIKKEFTFLIRGFFLEFLYCKLDA